MAIGARGKTQEIVDFYPIANKAQLKHELSYLHWAIEKGHICRIDRPKKKKKCEIASRVQATIFHLQLQSKMSL